MEIEENSFLKGLKEEHTTINFNQIIQFINSHVH